MANEDQKPGTEETAQEAQQVEENGTQEDGVQNAPESPAQPTFDTSAIDARFDALEQQVSQLTEALTTMSVVNEDGAGDGDPSGGVDDEYGEALELDDVERMLGL